MPPTNLFGLGYGVGPAGYGYPSAGTVAAPPTISYASPQSWTYGVAISTLSPTTTGATSFAVTTGALPTGLSLNASTGAITGTPTAWAASGSFKVTATGAGGSTESGAVAWTMAFDPATYSLVKYYDVSIGPVWQDSAETTLATANNDPVGAIRDTGSAAVDLLQATASMRLTLKKSVQNGLDGVDSDGVDDFISCAYSQAQAYTVFLVGSVTSPANGVFYYDAGSAVQCGNGGFFDIYAGSFLNSSVAVDSSVHQITAVFNGASSKMRIDGSEVASGAAGANGITNLKLFSQVIPTAGRICVIGFVSGVASAGTISAIEAFMKARWATP